MSSEGGEIFLSSLNRFGTILNRAGAVEEKKLCCNEFMCCEPKTRVLNFLGPLHEIFEPPHRSINMYNKINKKCDVHLSTPRNFLIGPLGINIAHFGNPLPKL